MYLRFWISEIWLNRIAQHILAEPFTESTPYVGEVRGLYYVGYTRRCPHGVKITLSDNYYDYDSGPGFFLRTEPGECYRFHIGYPLGGGWYACD